MRTWDRDAVRVQARHTSRTRVRANLVGTQLRVDVDADRGPGSADLELSVPAWINLRIDGNNCFVEVAGVSGAVSVKTVEGDIVLTGLSGTVDAESVEGKITLEGGRGRVQLSTVEGDIGISKAGGEIVADSVDGNIALTETQASAVEISTVDGDVSYSGALLATGRYLFTTHDGDITMAIPENTSATFSVRTFGDSRVDSTLPLKQGSERAPRTARDVHARWWRGAGRHRSVRRLGQDPAARRRTEELSVSEVLNRAPPHLRTSEPSAEPRTNLRTFEPSNLRTRTGSTPFPSLSVEYDRRDVADDRMAA